MKTIGEKLAHVRALYGLSQRELGGLTGISPKTIESAEARSSNTLNRAVIAALSRHFNVPEVYWITDDFRPYIRLRYYSLDSRARAELLAKPAYERIALVIRDLERFWGPDEFSVSKMTKEIVRPTEEELRKYMEGAQSLSTADLEQVLDYLDIPKELLDPLEPSLRWSEKHRFLRAIKLAVDLGMTSIELIKLIADSLFLKDFIPLVHLAAAKGLTPAQLLQWIQKEGNK